MSKPASSSERTGEEKSALLHIPSFIHNLVRFAFTPQTKHTSTKHWVWLSGPHPSLNELSNQPDCLRKQVLVSSKRSRQLRCERFLKKRRAQRISAHTALLHYMSAITHSQTHSHTDGADHLERWHLLIRSGNYSHMHSCDATGTQGHFAGLPICHLSHTLSPLSHRSPLK